MDDEALIDTVESILGKGIEIVDCETKSSIKQEEILLINGIPVKLDDNNHEALHELLVSGQIPSCNLINDILIKAGILNRTVQLETSLSVKSTIIEKEEIKIECNGQLLNEKLLEKKENNFYTSSCSEILEPYLNLNLLGENISDNSSCRPAATIISPLTLSSNSNCSIDESDRSLIFNSDFLLNKLNTISVDSGHHDDTNLSTQESLTSSSYDVMCLSSNDSSVAVNSQSNLYYFGEPQKFMPTIFGTTVTSQIQTNINKPQNGKKSNNSIVTTPETSAECVTTTTTTTTTKTIECTDQNSLVYRDGNLISGTLQALIQHMVPTGVYYPDKSYLFAFLLSSRLFIKPYELLEQICLTCEKQQNLNNILPASARLHGGSSDDRENLINFSNQFIQLLTDWMEIFPYDFRDDRIMQHVRYMTQKLINIDSKLSKECSKLLQHLLQRLKILDNYEEFLRKINLGELNYNNLIDTELLLINSCSIVTNPCQYNAQSNTIKYQSSQEFSSCGGSGGGGGGGCTGGGGSGGGGPQSGQSASSLSSLSISTSSQTSILNIINSNDLTDLCPNPSYLAQQLTHIELERLYHIGPEEFVQAFAKDNPNVTTTIRDVKKTKNLEAYVQWFNRLSYLVASEIVKYSKKKQRVRLIEYWIETARECFNIGNFNSLMAIIAGLNMAPILRLKKTWAKIQSAKFSILEHQMDPSSNFNSYRSTLKAAMWRSAGATDERQRIVIPFFSLLVKDLYFLNEGCSSKLPNGHINFEKFWQLAKQVTEFITWKQVTCPFNKNLKIIMLLQTCNVLNENSLAMTSFECEPPDNNLEKDRYKSLKQEQNH